jgi:hypothetical protein
MCDADGFKVMATSLGHCRLWRQVGVTRPLYAAGIFAKWPRWLLRVFDGVATISSIYGLAGLIWILAHPAAYTFPPDARVPLAVLIWLFDLPLFCLGLMWLLARFAFAYGESYVKLEGRFPFLRIWLPFGGAIAIGALFAGVIYLVSWL